MIKKVVLTGGACVGKTTLIDLFTAKGYSTLSESGREIYIAEQERLRKDPRYNPKFPQTDYVSFEEMVIQRQLDKEKTLEPGIYFLDRSLVDCLGMSFFQGRLLKSDIRRLISQAGYHKKVFFLSQFGNYENDEQRKESREEMLRMHEEIKRAYILSGFNVVEVPAMTPEERVGFILENLKED